MAEGDVTRRLTTIVAADIAGYTRLMGADDEGTLAALRAHRSELIDPKIAEHGGRIANTAGDSLLLEFPSVVDALRCAIDVQQGMRERNAEVPRDRRIEYRIGINVGDVMAEGEDLLGDGVNVAARIEGLAEPGGICLSRTARDQVRNRSEVVLGDLGEIEVKNIDQPVRVFKVLFGGEAAPTYPRRPSRRISPLAISSGIALLIVIVATAGVLLWRPWEPDFEPARPSEMAFPLPTKPSIVVLPFDNLTGDEGQDHLADGLSENIISTLATMPELFVIARNSAFTYKDKAVQVKTVAEDLGVRFVLEGSVQRSDDTVRVTAQLIDAVRGFHIWTKSYDRTLTNLFALQDEISGQIATALEVKLTEGEQARLRRKSTSKPEAYQLYLQGKANFRLFTRRDMKRAESLFEQALAVDPRFVAAIVELAHVHYVYGRVGWSDDPDASFGEAEALVRQALEIDPDYPEAFTSLGRIERSWRRDFDEAQAYHRKAVALAPNCAECLRELANELQYVGNGAQAIPIFKQAMRLEPNYSHLYLSGLGVAYNLTGEREKALQTFEEMTKRWPNNHIGYLYMAITHSMMGQVDEARRLVGEVLRLRPGLRASLYARYTPYKDRARAKHEADLLREAGMPE